MSLPPWRDTTIVAYLDEPPFAISGRAGERPSGYDMDVAFHVLTSAGVGDISYVRTTFHELIPGLVDQRWHLTAAIFVTDARAEVVDFSRPIWAVMDGFIVRRHDVARMTSYETIAATHATLAVVAGQVQRETAIGAGVPADQIVEFPDQEAAVEAVRRGAVDASASTAIVNRALVERTNDSTLAAVAATSRSARAPVGAFAVGKHLPDLTAALDDVIGRYLGTADHLALMRRYGFSDDELAPVLPGSLSARGVRWGLAELSQGRLSARGIRVPSVQLALIAPRGSFRRRSSSRQSRPKTEAKDSDFVRTTAGQNPSHDGEPGGTESTQLGVLRVELRHSTASSRVVTGPSTVGIVSRLRGAPSTNREDREARARGTSRARGGMRCERRFRCPASNGDGAKAKPFLDHDAKSLSLSLAWIAISWPLEGRTRR